MEPARQRERTPPQPSLPSDSRCLGECARGQFPTPAPCPFKGLQNKLQEGTAPPLRSLHRQPRTGFSRSCSPDPSPNEAEPASSGSARAGLVEAAQLIPTQGPGEPHADSGDGDRVPSSRASGRAAVKHLWCPAGSGHPLKRDSVGCGGVYRGKYSRRSRPAPLRPRR